MSLLRKIIARHLRLLPVLAMLLLVQMQQVMACEIAMIVPPAKTGSHCAMHQAGATDLHQKADPALTNYCKTMSMFAAGSQCLDKQDQAVTPARPDKWSQDHTPVYVIGILPHTLYSGSTPVLLTVSLARTPLRPGTETYLTTQRLRI